MNNFIAINLNIINWAVKCEQKYYSYRFMMDLSSLVAHETSHGIIRNRFKEFNYHTPIRYL